MLHEIQKSHYNNLFSICMNRDQWWPVCGCIFDFVNHHWFQFFWKKKMRIKTSSVSSYFKNLKELTVFIMKVGSFFPNFWELWLYIRTICWVFRAVVMNPKNYPDNCQGFVAVFFFIMTRTLEPLKVVICFLSIFWALWIYIRNWFFGFLRTMVMNLENHPDNHPTLLVPTIDKYGGCKNTWPFFNRVFLVQLQDSFQEGKTMGEKKKLSIIYKHFV